MAKAIDVAKYFISKANFEGTLITNLTLQKLLYYAQAWHLVYFKKPLFDDVIEAWDYGPVVPSIYGKYKKFGASPITEEQKNDIKFSEETIKFLDDVYGVFIKIPPHELVKMTHHETPWKNAYRPKYRNEIALAAMQEFYSKVLRANKN